MCIFGVDSENNKIKIVEKPENTLYKKGYTKKGIYYGRHRT